MYPVDLENNEKSCEYSAIVVPKIHLLWHNLAKSTVYKTS